IMHFCPSPDCRKWFHQSCLSKAHLKKDFPPELAGLSYLASNPDSLAVCSPMFNEFTPRTYSPHSPASAELASAVSSAPPPPAVPCAKDGYRRPLERLLHYFGHRPDYLGHLPTALLAVAQRPIVRAQGADGGWAIGNVADVVLARRLVYAALEHRGSFDDAVAVHMLAERHRKRVARVRAIGAARRADAVTAALNELAEDVQQMPGVEAFAVPRKEYWERRAEECRGLGALFDGVVYECPQCGNAI
ncbi:uncharacterized protein BXZ73DRAFT_50167, partial [Epithele typhae]|uniref:uncharacterized protein n=1 Tax=Epithele typhae TaxID=378194 RepID=UPI002008C06C